MNTTTIRPRRTRAAVLGLAALAMLGLSLGLASPALAHDELVDRGVVATDDGRVDGIRLTFNNSIIEVGTEIVITSSDGADVTDGAPEVSGPDVVQPLAAELPEGDYDVAWRVVSSDGHPIEGAFVLQLTEPSAWQAEEAAIVEPDSRFEDGSEDGSVDEHDAADHDHDHDADSGSAAAGDEGGLSTGAIAAISIGAVLVAGGALAAVLVGRRRRAAGMRAAGTADGSSTASSDEEDRA
ncbi:copper resistance protein CopC [Leucobacter sp. UCD-THU]|uniref:copper resistance CopC family protein n=1 Tax=Leucobacter sp. UCD-THU TaxID=1292023 RepID=UPI00035EFC97|nr:copper resistance protein CopC [Leucobacter sp. UCD-THU]EYT53188.1 copper resistance protein CopC [Leucobacter sp. UCD-THU]